MFLSAIKSQIQKKIPIPFELKIRPLILKQIARHTIFTTRWRRFELNVAARLSGYGKEVASGTPTACAFRYITPCKASFHH